MSQEDPFRDRDRTGFGVAPKNDDRGPQPPSCDSCGNVTNYEETDQGERICLACDQPWNLDA